MTRVPFRREPNDPVIAKAFRTQELVTRAERRARRIAEAENEIALQSEYLSAAERERDKQILRELQEQALQFEADSSPGYWQRLWRALLNR